MPLIFEDGNPFGFQRRRIKKRQFGDILVPLLVADMIKKEREWYILPRSTHWVEVCLFSSEFFSDAQFQDVKNFVLHTSRAPTPLYPKEIYTISRANPF